MPLLAIWETSPDQVRALSLPVVIGMAGRGGLVDDGECARTFRTFLRLVDPDMLETYVGECLQTAGKGKKHNGFPDSGLALQDVVNEIGRRLGFEVEDGLYQGGVNVIGYDGIWRGPGGLELVVEMKTTAVYNIRLETIERYRTRLIEAGRLSETSSVLFVVGRDETGSLEEQIRGSRYAWSMRVIGAAALVHLMKVMVRADDEAVADQIRALLRPVEYTRLDGIVDLVFRVREDVDEPSPDDPPSPDDGPQTDAEAVPPKTIGSGARRAASAPPTAGAETLREAAAARISDAIGQRLIRKRRSLFETADGRTRVVIAVSKRYSRAYQSYWYAFYDTQKAWLEEAANAWVALCAADTGAVYLIPLADFERHLPGMNATRRDEDRAYWHVLIRLEDEAFVLVRTDGVEQSLATWALAAS